MYFSRSSLIYLSANIDLLILLFTQKSGAKYPFTFSSFFATVFSPETIFGIIFIAAKKQYKNLVLKLVRF